MDPVWFTPEGFLSGETLRQALQSLSAMIDAECSKTGAAATGKFSINPQSSNKSIREAAEGFKKYLTDLGRQSYFAKELFPGVIFPVLEDESNGVYDKNVEVDLVVVIKCGFGDVPIDDPDYWLNRDRLRQIWSQDVLRKANEFGLRLSPKVSKSERSLSQ